MIRHLASALCLLAVASTTLAQTGPVMYRVDLAQAAAQVIRIEMTLDGVRTDEVDVRLPVWRPGLYAVLDQAGTIRTLAAKDPDGEALDAVKVDKSTWRITSAGKTSIRVVYDVWAASLDNRTRHADDTHVFMSPSTTFLYADAWRNLPVEVSITHAPRGWSLSTGMESSPDAAGGWTISAPDYDVLADSPLEVGVHEVISFDVDGVPHELVLWTGAAPSQRIRDTDLFKKTPDAIAAIVRAQKAIFGALPYDRYVFILHCYPGARGGTEHLNSTVIQAPPEAFYDETRHRRFLSLVSHEVFHTWNVKRFRPAGLVPYDYQRENYTELLWLAEGTTSYYEDLVLVRAGLMKQDDFLKGLAESIDALRSRPGNSVQSLRDSSFDAWIKYNRRTADAANSTVSFYDKGALASFILDMTIRTRTKNARSLDDLMRRLFERFPSPNHAYTTHDVRAILDDLGGDYDEFFRTAIDGTGDLDFEDALRTAGLELHRDNDNANQPDAGVTLSDQSGLASVTEVRAPGPGTTAGLIPGDVIVGVDAQRVRVADWDKLLERHTPGDTLAITYFRNDQLRETRLTLASRPKGKLTARRVKDADDLAAGVYSSWLGQPWPGDTAGETPPAR